MTIINSKFLEWIEEIYKDLERYSMSIAGPDICDEILNNSLLYVIKHKDRLSEHIEDKKHLKNYLKLKTKMELNTYYRNKKNIESIFREDDEGNFEIRDEIFYENTQKEFGQEEYIDLNKCMSKLSAMCRELLTMKSERYTDSEISNILGVAIGTVGSRHTRCMQKLRELYFGNTEVKI
jgi:RNA polymerase sigma factor (sigma-70 family)